MLRIASITALIGAAFLLSSGCKPESPSDKTKDAAPHEHGPDADHDHGETGHDHGETGHDDDAGPEQSPADPHAGHDHGEAGHDDDTDHGATEGHGHGGKPHLLGSHEIAGLTVEIVQFGPATGDIAELVFEIEVRGEPAPTAIRMLVRTADGAESLKVKANKVGDHEYDAHVGELPPKLGQGSVLVIEVETPSGNQKLTLPLAI